MTSLRRTSCLVTPFEIQYDSPLAYVQVLVESLFIYFSILTRPPPISSLRVYRHTLPLSCRDGSPSVCFGPLTPGVRFLQGFRSVPYSGLGPPCPCPRGTPSLRGSRPYVCRVPSYLVTKDDKDPFPFSLPRPLPSPFSSF